MGLVDVLAGDERDDEEADQAEEEGKYATQHRAVLRVPDPDPESQNDEPDDDEDG
jgi:hypothetical protein